MQRERKREGRKERRGWNQEGRERERKKRKERKEGTICRPSQHSRGILQGRKNPWKWGAVKERRLHVPEKSTGGCACDPQTEPTSKGTVIPMVHLMLPRLSGSSAWQPHCAHPALVKPRGLQVLESDTPSAGFRKTREFRKEKAASAHSVGSGMGLVCLSLGTQLPAWC